MSVTLPILASLSLLGALFLVVCVITKSAFWRDHRLQPGFQVPMVFSTVPRRCCLALSASAVKSVRFWTASCIDHLAMLLFSCWNVCA